MVQKSVDRHVFAKSYYIVRARYPFGIYKITYAWVVEFSDCVHDLQILLHSSSLHINLLPFQDGSRFIALLEKYCISMSNRTMQGGR